jgi:hypothetical protein
MYCNKLMLFLLLTMSARMRKMLSSRKGQAMAIVIAMLMVGTAATVHVQGGPQAETQSSAQVDVLAMMSQVRNMPVDTVVQP